MKIIFINMIKKNMEKRNMFEDFAQYLRSTEEYYNHSFVIYTESSQSQYNNFKDYVNTYTADQTWCNSVGYTVAKSYILGFTYSYIYNSIVKYGNSDILLQIVNVLDDFDRALNVKEENLTPEVKNFLVGFKLIDKSLKDILTSNNVKEIECLGEKFDPNMEQSLCSKSDSSKEDEEVLEILTKGYTYYDRVLRYASVMINKKENKEEINNTSIDETNNMKGND